MSPDKTGNLRQLAKTPTIFIMASKAGFLCLSTSVVAVLFYTTIIESNKRPQVKRLATLQSGPMSRKSNLEALTLPVSTPIAAFASIPTVFNPAIAIKSEYALIKTDRSRELAQEGDSAKFFGYTVVRTPIIFREDNPDIVLLREAWTRDAARFLEDELRIIDADKSGVIQDLHEEAFRRYYQKTDKLIGLAKESFGPDVAIVLEGDLNAEYNQSSEEYENSLKELMGVAGYQRFSHFRQTYREHIVASLGWLPGSVIE